MNIEIRIAHSSDIESITKLHGDLSDMHDLIDPIHSIGAWNSEEYKIDLAKQIEDNDFHVSVAEIDSIIVGYCIVAIKNNTLGHIWEIYVDPIHRKNGVGTKLYENAMQWLRKCGVKTVYLYVDSRNEIGLKAWESFGFKEYMKKMKLDL